LERERRESIGIVHSHAIYLAKGYLRRGFLSTASPSDKVPVRNTCTSHCPKLG
jgi:hypothetical protein